MSSTKDVHASLPSAPADPPPGYEQASSQARTPGVIGPDGERIGCFADSSRLQADITGFAQISSDPERLIRLGYTETERTAHAAFAERMDELGLKVWADAAGNTIAEHPGRSPELGAVGTGSHLDSVPEAGRFDGIAGVAAALELARLVTTHEIPHEHPLRFVAFAAEEGARFGQACLGSRFASGLVNEWQLAHLRDERGVSLGEAMRSVGLDGTDAARTPWSVDEWSAFIELHVEQGGVLEATATEIGVVDLVSGSTRLRLSLTGRASHTGATPMELREDALTASAEIVLIAESVATDAHHRGTRATVGQLEVYPGSITTIPGKVSLSLDIRDIDSDRQRATATEILRRARAVCDRRRVRLSVSLIGDTSPVVLPIWLRLVAADACRNSEVSYRVMTSGASHDAQVINQLVPSAILFVPSEGGLSHVPEEWTSATDLARGTSVLLSMLLRVDAELVRLRTLGPVLDANARAGSR